MSAQGGWGSLGGWASFGGWASSGGWAAAPGSLADGFANPLLASGLVSSREATVHPGDIKGLNLPPPAREAATLERWEPWVRSSVALQALLSGLRVSGTKDKASVVHVEPGGATVPVATLTPPSEADFRKQLRLVLSWAELREERLAEILGQIDNQTPFVAAVPYLHPSRTPRTLELLGIAMQLAVPVEMRVKHELACWRPVEYSPQVQPMITTPGHGSLPSGHATQAYMLVEVLLGLLGLRGQESHPTVVQLRRLAARIATNRVVAGVHFPVDSIAGRLLGTVLGEYFLVRCGQGSGKWRSRVFDGRRAFDEFNPHRQPLQGKGMPKFYGFRDEASVPSADELLVHLWAKAWGEWVGRQNLQPAR